MEKVIRDEILRFVRESPDNRFPDGDRPYFEEPLIGFAAADDPLFREYKRVIGDFHLTPGEIMENTYGVGIGDAQTVVCRVLPISRATRESNRREKTMPSREWALTLAHGEHFNTLLRMHLVEMLGLVPGLHVRGVAEDRRGALRRHGKRMRALPDQGAV